MCDDSLTFEEKLDLCSWGLPEHILQKYFLKGVKKMFPWQVECLTSGDVLLGGNLIYSAPTSAGKTLVAEILAIKTVLERRKKVIIILPFVSVVREKMIYFQEILSGSGIRVEGFMGSYHPPGGFCSVHLAICTIEKANNLINRLMEERNLDDIGTVIVDELHLLGDPHRGYLLELLLTKLKFICLKGLSANIQIIGMSATLPNLDLLASWMNATLYHTDFRPIPLFEYLKIGRNVYKSPDLLHSFEMKPIIDIKNDPGDVIYLCVDTIIQGYSLLVFCPSKNWCETLAVQISSEIKKIGNEKNSIGTSLRNELNPSGISDILEQLKKCPVGLEKNLAQSVSFGVAYHHAGLTLEERDIIEGGFKQNVLRVLVATSTLSSGVNLPARRVIIRSPGFHGQCMDILTYKQMIGRAGRMGKDTVGESYIICTEADQVWGKHLLTSKLPAVKSCLGQGNLSSSLKRALLEVIASGLVSTNSEVLDYTKCTLLAISVSEDRMSQAIDCCTTYLQDNEFIKVNFDGNILPSALAEACLSASVPPDQALYLLRELHKARQSFVLDSDLHAIYQVTPYSICDYLTVDWMRFFTIWENLSPNLQKIGEIIGVEDRFLIKAMRGTINLNSDEHVYKVSIHKRFYTALVLQDLINEIPLNEVALKFDCHKGILQSLQQSASTFAVMVTSFCRRLGWGGLEVLLSEMSTRIQFGVQKELLDLLRLDCMTALMARTLFNDSVTSISELASSPFTTVQFAIRKAIPFESETISCDQREKKNVYLLGRPGLSEIQAAALLIQEARNFLLKEMGVKTAQWETDNVKSVNDAVYDCSTICIDEQGQNKNSDSCMVNQHHEAEKYKNSNTFNKNQLNSEERVPVQHDTKEFINISAMYIKDAFALETYETVEASGKEKNIDPIRKNPEVHEGVVNYQAIAFSSDVRNNQETFDNNDHSASEAKDNNRHNQVENRIEKDSVELNDTELIDSDFVCKVTEKIVNESKYSFVFDKILEGKIKQPHDDNIPLNIVNNHGFDTMSTSEIEKEFKEEERTIKNCQEVESMLSAHTCENKDKVMGNILDSKEHYDNWCRVFNTSIDKTDLENFPSLREYTKPSSIDMPIPDVGQSNLFFIGKKDVMKSASNTLTGNQTNSINPNCSTPVGVNEANLSNNDIFSDSPQLFCSSMKQETDSIKNQTLEEFDINWGGDSLLEFSQIETKILESFYKKNALKRKLSDPVEEFNCSKKKICLPKEEYICKEYVNKSFFHNNSACNTKIENRNSNDKYYKSSLSSAKSKKNKSEVFNKPNSSKSEYLKLKNHPKSDGNFSPKPIVELKENNILMDKFVSNTCNSPTFKSELNDMLKKVVHSDKDELDLLDFSISDSEDFITMSPEQFQKHKTDFSLKSTSGNNNIPCQLSSPAKITPKSSPAKCNTPLKYPPIGGDIVKIYKSPNSKKNTSLNALIHSSKKKKGNKSTKCLMVEYAKSCDDIQVIKIDEVGVDANQIIENIYQSGEISFMINIKKISEAESNQMKIGSKILKSTCSHEQIHYRYSYGDEAIIGIYFFDGKTIYDFDMTLAEEKNVLLLNKILSREDLNLLGINTKKILKLLYNCSNIVAKCKVFDIGVAEWLLNPEEKYKSLEELAKEYISKSAISDYKMDNTVSEKLIILRDLKVELTRCIKAVNLEKLFTEVEMPIQRCLLFMELTGIEFDYTVVSELWSLSTELMGKLEIDAFNLAKHKFSLNSNIEFSKVKRSLKILPDQEIKNPIIEIVRDWRKLHSLKTKNLSQLLFAKSTTRLYCHSSTRSVTGRIMIYDPDLQHIPRDFKVGEKLFSLRSAFVARVGNVLVSADYGQLELRILAHFSQDPVLLPLLRKNDDIFKSIAAEWNGISTEMVNEEMRHQVKQICYGIIYGMGDKALGEALGKTASESSMLSAHFKRSFPKLNDFIKNTIKECQQTGKIKTLAGRFRYLPSINSSLSYCKAQAERQAINSKIQGSAADIAKKAMVAIEACLNKLFPDRKSFPTTFHSSHLVLQLHDELIFEVNESLQDRFIVVLRDVMEKSTVLSVPLPVVIKVGKNWGCLKKIL